MDLAITNVSVIDVVSGGDPSKVLVNEGKIARVLTIGWPSHLRLSKRRLVFAANDDMHVHIGTRRS